MPRTSFLLSPRALQLEKRGRFEFPGRGCTLGVRGVFARECTRGLAWIDPRAHPFSAEPPFSRWVRLCVGCVGVGGDLVRNFRVCCRASCTLFTLFELYFICLQSRTVFEAKLGSFDHYAYLLLCEGIFLRITNFAWVVQCYNPGARALAVRVERCFC